jgi:hypothetical protein
VSGGEAKVEEVLIMLRYEFVIFMMAAVSRRDFCVRKIKLMPMVEYDS